MLWALTKPVCEAATDFGVNEPVNVLINFILLSVKSLACAGEIAADVARAKIEMPAAILKLRMPARVLLEINRYLLRQIHGRYRVQDVLLVHDALPVRHGLHAHHRHLRHLLAFVQLLVLQFL